jgi:transcriptional regulator with XRE-family HTH domain
VTTRAQAIADAEVYRSLGFRMQALRQVRGWSRAVLAHRTRLSAGTLAKYEHGTVRAVDLVHLRQIAAALGTTPGALLDGTPGPVVISEEAAATVLAASQASGLTAAQVIEQALADWMPPLGPPPYPEDDLMAQVTGPGLDPRESGDATW